MVSKRSQIFYWTSMFTILISITIISIFSGYHHELTKFKTMLVALFAVLIFQYMLADPVQFTLLSIDASCWRPEQQKFVTDHEATYQTRLQYLQLRLRALQSQLRIPEKHRNENTNEVYRSFCHDIMLYGQYFLLMIVLVFMTCDEYLYYTTRNLEGIFNRNNTISMGLKDVDHITELYGYMESTLVNVFNQGEHQDFIHAPYFKLLGSVQIRQMRLTEQLYGMRVPSLSNQKYMPEWKLPYKELPYAKSYWRIYSPWVPAVDSGQRSLHVTFKHNEFYRSYPGEGYVTLLARTQQNSRRVLEYLRDYKWFTYNTSCVYIEFTLYSVDANLFNECTLRLEQTPFGSLILYAAVDSLRLLDGLDQRSLSDLLILLIYTICFIEFFRALCVKLWYSPTHFMSSWDKLDLIIFVLNISLAVLYVVHSLMMSVMLKRIEAASKMEYFNFKQVTYVHRVTRVIVGLMLALTTLRLWKTFQFFSAFQLFTRTLYLAWRAVASTAIVIFIFLIAFAMSISIINGNNSNLFNELNKSVITCMCLVLGFAVGIEPEELFYGGEVVGIIQYTTLTFIMSVMLINVFISLINDYFTTAKEQRDITGVREINIVEFLLIEHAVRVRCFRLFRCFHKRYKSRNRTVAENIAIDLAALQLYRERTKKFEMYNIKKKITQADVELEIKEFKWQQEQMYTMAAIMNTQMQLLDLLL